MNLPWGTVQFTHFPGWIPLLAGSAVVVALLAYSYHHARGRARLPLRWSLLALRCVAVGLISLCLLDPQNVEKKTHRPPARLAVLLDTSKSMATQDVPHGRFEAARQWLQQNLVAHKPAHLATPVFSFGQTMTSLPDVSRASPTGALTAMASAMENLLAAPADEPLTGVILLSDGIDTSTQSPELVARKFLRAGIPVHTVTLGTTNDQRDVVLENVRVKRAVPNESPTRVEVSLRSSGFPNAAVTVQIRRNREVLASQSVRLNGAAQQVDLDFTPRHRGFQIYEVVVSPSPDEWLASNNRRSFGLEVTDPILRVLYMEGTPQQKGSPIPEWKYLKDALQSDPQIQVTVLYRQQGSKGERLNTIDADPETGERIYPVEHPTRGFPRTLAGLLEYDVVIHSDIRINSFQGEQLPNLARLVEQHGGGFVMIGGNSAFGKGGYHRTVLDRIIPVAMQSSDDSETRPITLRVPPTALKHPLIEFTESGAATKEIWSTKFPSLYGMNHVERAKPGATVLARADSDTGNVLIAVQDIGNGRSMAFTSDTTRSWGRDFETIWGEATGRTRADGSPSDSRYFRQFWVNAVRWLAAGKMSRTNSAVTLELTQGSGAPGDVVQAAIKVRNPDQQEISTADVAVYAGTGNTSNRIALAKYDAARRTYLADIKIPGSGAQILTAVASQRGVRLGDDRQLLVGEETDRELADLRARPALMAAIARASGGHAFTSLNTRDQIPALFANSPAEIVQYSRSPLWDKAGWLGAILAVLCGEWALRRARGLA